LASCAPKDPAPLRIGINAWPGYEFIYLAQVQGYYKDVGIAVDIVEFNSLSDVRRSFERGQLDGFATTCVEVLLAREHVDRDLQIIQAVDYSNGGDLIVAREGIASVEELKGKRVGVEVASVCAYVLAAAAERSQLSLGDFTIVPGDQLGMVDQFAMGDLDAVVTYPPSSIRMLKESGASVVFSSAEIPGQVVDVIAMDAAIVKGRREEVTAFLRAFHLALDYSKQHPEEAYAVMAKREGITPKEFGEALNNDIHMIGKDEQSDYLKPGGKLSAVLDKSDSVLRQTGQISGPDRRPGAFTDAALDYMPGEVAH
jgi:NitT/TauT family transport system substrate-binding protein